MENIERIHNLFEKKQYIQLYNEYTELINKMILVSDFSEFEDFLSEEEDLDENVFLLFYRESMGYCVSVGAYEGNITAKVNQFLKSNLSDKAFELINGIVNIWYVDIDDDENSFEEQIKKCNEKLIGTIYSLIIQFDDTYYSGVYFLSVKSKLQN